MHMASIEDTTVTDNRLPPTDVRFGMRALLVLMGGVAIAAALFGILLRKIPEEFQTLSTVICGGIAAVLTGCFIYAGWRRRLLEMRAGTPRFVLVPHSYLFPHAPRLGSKLIGITAILYGVSVLVFVGFMFGERFSGRLGATLAWNSMYAIMAVLFGVSMLWWNRAVHLCDDGLLLRNQFVPWSKLQRYYWDACDRDVIVLDTWLAVHVPVEDRTAVEQFVAARITATSARTHPGDDGKSVDNT